MSTLDFKVSTLDFKVCPRRMAVLLPDVEEEYRDNRLNWPPHTVLNCGLSRWFVVSAIAPPCSARNCHPLQRSRQSVLALQLRSHSATRRRSSHPNGAQLNPDSRIRGCRGASGARELRNWQWQWTAREERQRTREESQRSGVLAGKRGAEAGGWSAACGQGGARQARMALACARGGLGAATGGVVSPAYGNLKRSGHPGATCMLASWTVAAVSKRALSGASSKFGAERRRIASRRMVCRASADSAGVVAPVNPVALEGEGKEEPKPIVLIDQDSDAEATTVEISFGNKQARGPP